MQEGKEVLGLCRENRSRLPAGITSLHGDVDRPLGTRALEDPSELRQEQVWIKTRHGLVFAFVLL